MAMQALEYSVSEELCGAQYRAGLRIQVREVLGEAPQVDVDRSYVVRGMYHLSDSEIDRLLLTGHGRNQGRPFCVAEGSGEFEVTTKPIDLAEGHENALDLVMFNQAGRPLGVRLRILLAANASENS